MSMASVALSPVHEESLDSHRNFPWLCGLRSSDPIVIFLVVERSIDRLQVLESDSIALVKLRIQASKGYSVNEQILVFEGRELARGNSQVRDYGVADGKVLHLVVRSNLQAIIARTLCGKVYKFRDDRGKSVGYVKKHIAKIGKGLDLVYQELVCDGEALEDQRLITDICKSNDAVVHLLIFKSAKVRGKPVEKDFELSIEALDLNEKEADCLGEHQQGALYMGYRVTERKPLLGEFLLEPLIVNSKIQLPLVIRELMKSTFNGLERGNEPIRSSEGSGGAYFMQDSSGQKYVSVFKPIDEEPMAVNNPQGLPLSVDGEGLKKGTRVGEGALREVAAYILDHPKSGPRSSSGEERGFAGVPPTAMVKCLHRGFNHPNGYQCDSKNIKIGSLQMFVENIGSCEDRGPSSFPVAEVHKISVLDIRLANADRHAGNILVSKDCEHGQIVLIPIDHGYCFPTNFEDCTFDWLYWPQAQQPYSHETVEYIKALDVEQDIALLKFHGWDMPPECARTLHISTMLLKKGAERGLTPFAIGSLMCRETVKKESVVEQIVQEAQDAVLPGSGEATFLEAVSLIMDRHLDNLSPRESRIKQ